MERQGHIPQVSTGSKHANSLSRLISQLTALHACSSEIERVRQMKKSELDLVASAIAGAVKGALVPRIEVLERQFAALKQFPGTASSVAPSSMQSSARVPNARLSGVVYLDAKPKTGVVYSDPGRKARSRDRVVYANAPTRGMPPK